MCTAVYAEESWQQLCGWQILEEPICLPARICPAEDHPTTIKDGAGLFRLTWNGFQDTVSEEATHRLMCTT